MRNRWKGFSFALVIGVSLCGIVWAESAQSNAGRVTLNGVVFSLPQGYVRVPGEARENTILLYDKQHRDGMVVAVPAVPFVEQDVINNLRNDSKKAFFPKETLPYQWKSADLLHKVSKFETKDALAKGLNKNHLLVFEYRHVVFNQRDLFVGTLFEARKGKPAQEMFKGEGAAMSMTTCGAAAELIYSFTGEKIDPERPPCELIATVP